MSELNKKDGRYTEKELKRRNFFQKAIVVGLTGIAIASAFGVLGNNNGEIFSFSGDQKTQITQAVKQTQELGIGGNMMVKFNHLAQTDTYIYSEKNVDACVIQPRTSNAYGEVLSHEVKSDIVDEDFTINYYRDLLNVDKSNEGSMAVFDAYVGVAKCDMKSNPELYNVFSDASLNAKFKEVETKRFGDSTVKNKIGEIRVQDDLTDLLEAGYSESMAYILFKKSDFTAEQKSEILVKKEVSARFRRLEDAGVTTSSLKKLDDVNGSIVAHDVIGVYNFFKQDGMNERIMNANSAKELRELANEASQYNFKQVLASKDSNLIYSQTYINRNAVFAAKEIYDDLTGAYLTAVPDDGVIPDHYNLKIGEGIWKDIGKEVWVKIKSDQKMNDLFKTVLREADYTNMIHEKHSIREYTWGMEKGYSAVHQSLNLETGKEIFAELRDGFKDMLKDVEVHSVYSQGVDDIRSSDVGQDLIRINRQYIKENQAKMATHQVKESAKFNM